MPPSHRTLPEGRCPRGDPLLRAVLAQLPPELRSGLSDRIDEMVELLGKLHDTLYGADEKIPEEDYDRLPFWFAREQDAPWRLAEAAENAVLDFSGAVLL